MCGNSCKRLKRKRNDGFTLVELLCVIAVVAVLAAVVFPALQAARRRALQAACASNLRQLWVGARMYMDEWEGLPASELWWADFGGGYVFFRNKVWWKQVKPKELLRCPGDFGAMLAWDQAPSTATVYESRGSSYMMMGELTWSDPLPYMEPQDPLLWDYVGFWHFPSRGVLDYNAGWSDNRQKWRHNTVRLDGSVCQMGYWAIIYRADHIEAVQEEGRLQEGR